MMFALARQLPAADASTQAGKWEKNRFMGVELYGKTLGLIGCGNIGSIVADRANGLKMKVIAYDPFLSAERAVEIGVEKVELDDLLHRADVITLHTPLTDKTRNILSRDALAKTRKGVLIINCARGGLGGRGRPARAAGLRPRRRRGLRRLRRGASQGQRAVRLRQGGGHPRTSAPPPWRPRRTSPCRWPSRWPTSCSPARSPTP